MIERADPLQRDLDGEHETRKAEQQAPKKVAPEAKSPESEIDLDDAVIQAKLTVGPASDPFEREADAVAARVVRTLRSETAVLDRESSDDTAPRVHRSAVTVGHGGDGEPSGDDDGDGESVNVGGRLRRIRRTSAPTLHPPISVRRIQRAANLETPAIGAEGGDLDADTTRMLRASRSGGKPLPDPARSKMESAFGADFGGIKVHTGPTSTELNDRIQAKAFTTGSDIYFRDNVPDVSSSSGQELLAHELTHTLQQGAAVNRAMLMRRWWPFGKKKKSGPPVIGAPTNVTLNNNADVEGELAKQGFHPVPLANPQIGQPAPPPGAKPYQGKVKKPGSAKSEVGKPAAAVTVAGGSAAGAGFGVGGSAGAEGAGAVGNMAAAGGAGAGALGVLTAIDAGMGLNNAINMDIEADEFGDAAMAKQSRNKAKDQGAALATGAVSTGRGIATLTNVLQGTAEVAKGATPAAAGVAAGALGVVGGSAMVIQGSWRGGKAVMKLCRLTRGRGETMLSPEGERWKSAFVASEKFKVAINALKIAAGALGIAAGALVIVGSPVGWCLGLAAAIAAGVYAVGKIAAKTSNAREKSKARHEDRQKSDISAPTHADVLEDEGRSYIDLGRKGYDMSKVIPAGPQNERDRGSGHTPEAHDLVEGEAERNEAIAEADRLARSASQNARTAAELRDALSHGDKDFVTGALAAASANEHADIAEMILDPNDRRLHDAFRLLSAVNIDSEEALAASGQLLIEQKLSKAEAM